MAKFLIYKIFTLLVTLFFLITASFFMLRTLPGSPFEEGRALAPEIIAKLEHKYGLDQPLVNQYCSYMQGLLTRFDLGPSLKYPNREVIDILQDAIPVSLELGLIAFVISSILGIALGIIAALYPHKTIGKLASQLASLGMSMPSFVFAGILIGVFGLKLGILPVALWEGPEYLILPALTLSIAPTAYIARITRSSMLDVLGKDHIRTALAKGLSYREVVIKHGLYNALLPIITVMGPLVAVLITGSFVVEFIYALPGMGKYFVTAFINRDYFLVSGVIVVFSLILLTANTVTDLLILKLNPKVTT